MLKLPETKEFQKVAQRLIWFKAPKKALRDPYTFMAHVITYGTTEDVVIVKKLWVLKDLKMLLSMFLLVLWI